MEKRIPKEVKAIADQECCNQIEYIGQLDGKDVFGQPARSGAVLTVINRSSQTLDYTADCSVCGLPACTGRIGPVSAEILVLA